MRGWCLAIMCALVPEAARADCSGLLAPVVAPPTVSYLPARPTLYVFSPAEYRVPDISVQSPEGRPLPFRAEEVSTHGALRAHRVTVDVGQGSFFLFVYKSYRFAYTIDPG